MDEKVRRTLNVPVEDNIIHTVRNIMILGFTYNNLLHFVAHATIINTKVKMRNKVLKALAGMTSRMDKEIIITTYKAIGDVHSSIMLL